MAVGQGRAVLLGCGDVPMRPSRKYLLRDCSRNREGLISFFLFFFLNSLFDEDGVYRHFLEYE